MLGKKPVVGFGVQAARDSGLIGDDHQPEIRPLQFTQRRNRSGQQRVVLDPVGVAAIFDDDAVTIDEGAPHIAPRPGPPRNY